MPAKHKNSTKGQRGSSDHQAPRSGDEMRSLARRAALAAITRLTELSNSDDERVALAASQELLNRAFGKIASAAGEEQGPAQQLVVKIVKFGAADAATTRDVGDGQERGDMA